MKFFTTFSMLSVLIASTCYAVPAYAKEKWSGVDEVVIGKFAEKMGKTPSDPLINTDQGDILLSMFLLFGAIGGFVAGYYYRELFPKKKDKGVGQDV